MREPILIQRGTFKDNKDFNGIDTLISFDYMGAAEFEFGALPASLKKMCVEADNMEILATPYKHEDGRGLFVVCSKNIDTKQVLTFIDGLVAEKYRLKEQAHLKQSLGIVKALSKYNIHDFWWDIDNQYMFCLGKDNAKKLVKAIKTVRDRKRDSNVQGWY